MSRVLHYLIRGQEELVAISESKEILNESSFGSIYDLLDSQYVVYVNTVGVDYSIKDNPFSNTLFKYYFVDGESVLRYIKKKYSIVDYVVYGNQDNDVNLFLKRVFKKHDKSFIRIMIGFSVIKSFFLFGVSILASLFYLTLHTFKKREIPDYQEVAIVHSRSSYSKINKFSQSSCIYLYDSILFSLKCKKAYPLYSWLLKRDIFKNYVYLVYNSICLFRDTTKKANAMYGFPLVIKKMSYIGKRIPHYILLEMSLDIALANIKPHQYLSGEKESRLAFLHNKLARKRGKYIQCIPHGLEYSFKYPQGLQGNKFFATSKYACEELRKLYPQTDFEFNEKIQKRINSYAVKLNSKSVNIVYFPEGRDTKIDEDILKELSNEVKVYVKLHPNDSKENYKSIENLIYIDDFALAISGNICISRKSTVLVEGLYNSSISIAILNNKKDQFLFENSYLSLGDKQILKYYSLPELINYLKSISS
ncbi:MAG: hypothetical protein WD449_00055 [Candidatus Babeliales bacterium]